jgi:hypothetical protein
MSNLVEIRDLNIRFTGERTVVRSTTSLTARAKCSACSAIRLRQERTCALMAIAPKRTQISGTVKVWIATCWR